MDVLELGLKPISDDSPGGADARYEPEYEEMEAEMAKLTNPSAEGGSISWDNLGKLSRTILAEKSKDMMAATYLVASLMHKDGAPGLAEGLAFYRAFIENFWDSMYPTKKRIRGRKNAAEWLYTHGEAFLRDNEQQPMPEEKLEAMKDDFEAINNFFSENMEDPPAYRQFLEVLNMLPVQPKAAPEPKSQSQEQTAPAQSQAAAPAPAAVEAGDMASDQDANRALQSGLKVLKQVAGFYLDNDLANPLSYQLLRLASWLTIPAPPLAEAGVTKIPAPPDQIKSVLDNLQAGTDPEALLKASETKVAQFLFWLDLSRMSHEALDQLGPRYHAARDAVASQTADFVKRLKGVENLAFADETPFADPATRQWIAEISAAGEGGGGAGGAAGAVDEKTAEEMEKARQLAKEKKLPEAVEVLQKNLLASPSGKDRMFWRVALVNMLVQAKKNQPAGAHVELILADIDRHGLDEWEPVLALEGYKAVLAALRFDKSDAAKDRVLDVIYRIARISPVEAMNLE